MRSYITFDSAQNDLLSTCIELRFYCQLIEEIAMQCGLHSNVSCKLCLSFIKH